jgi:hypothetical protein
MPDQYLEVISLIERLHRQFLEIVKLELEGLGIHDINNVQGIDALQHRRCRDDGWRTDLARLLSRVKRLLQRQEDAVSPAKHGSLCQNPRNLENGFTCNSLD